MDYFESEVLAEAWWTLLRPMLPLCHIAITSSALLLTAATFERFLTISKIRSQFSTSKRLLISALVLFFAAAAKGPMFFEMQVKIVTKEIFKNYIQKLLQVLPNGNCTGVTGYFPSMHDWVYEEPYNTFYKFWFRSIVSTFLPFFLSLNFNIRIIHRLRQQHVGAKLFRFQTSDHRVCFGFETTLPKNILYFYRNKFDQLQ